MYSASNLKEQVPCVTGGHNPRKQHIRLLRACSYPAFFAMSLMGGYKPRYITIMNQRRQQHEPLCSKHPSAAHDAVAQAEQRGCSMCGMPTLAGVSTGGGASYNHPCFNLCGLCHHKHLVQR